jgi:hypothetical protein
VKKTRQNKSWSPGFDSIKAGTLERDDFSWIGTRPIAVTLRWPPPISGMPEIGDHTAQIG